MRRRLISDMDLPEFAHRCLYGFWTDDPCEAPATHRGTDRSKVRLWGGEASQWRACDQHKHQSDVPWTPTD